MIGEDIITSIPMSIIVAIGNKSVTPTQTMISFDSSAFLPPLELIRMQYTPCYYGICVESASGIQSVEFLTECTYLDTIEWGALANKQPNDHPIQYFETLEYNGPASGAPFTENKGIPPFKLVSKGWVIEGSIDALNKLEIKYGDNVYLSMKRGMLSALAKRIGPSLLYVPFNSVAPMLNPSLKTFTGGLLNNSQDGNQLQYTIAFSEPQTGYKIHSLGSNKLRVGNGKGHILHASLMYTGYRYPHTSVTYAGQDIWDDGGERAVNPEKGECPISYETIGPGCVYAECAECKVCFLQAMLKRCFDVAKKSNCPMCREPATRWRCYRVPGGPGPATAPVLVSAAGPVDKQPVLGSAARQSGNCVIC
jgi:hypothetical protein